MFEATQAAVDNIREYLQGQKTNSPIRVTILSGGCSGSSLGLTLDQAGDNDQTFAYDDVSFVVDKDFLVISGAIKVDYVHRGRMGGGFVVTSANPMSSGGCGCSCSSGSCGSGC